MPLELQLLPPTKEREPDPSIRLTHIESLLLFCTTARGRAILRENGVYAVIKAAHLAESEAEGNNVSEEGGGVTEAIVRLVNLLQREEGGETEDDGDEYWDEVVAAKANAADDDDDDDQIVEIA